MGSIGPGILSLLGIGANDTEADLEWVMHKILKLRIFEDSSGKMNLSLKEVGGSHLIVSQFTLYADVTTGNRPGFTEAAKPDKARLLYERALEMSRSQGVKTAWGKFQAHMEVSLVNDGPVTFWIESQSSK